MVTRYQKRLSGPLLDRIDIHLDVPRVEYDKLASDRAGEPSSAVRARVEAARERQRARFADTALTCNADMGPGHVRRLCALEGAAQAVMRAAMTQLSLSARLPPCPQACPHHRRPRRRRRDRGRPPGRGAPVPAPWARVTAVRVTKPA
jgi:hypothetical protein